MHCTFINQAKPPPPNCESQVSFLDEVDEGDEGVVIYYTYTVTSFSTTKIVCNMPGGTGIVDIVVKGGNSQQYTFQRGY